MSIAIVAIAPFTAAEGGMAQQRGRQAQNQVKPAEQQRQSNPTVSRTEEPVDLVQEILGSRAGSRQVRSALQQPGVRGVSQPQSLHSLLQSVSPDSLRVQAKPLFRGVSQEWSGAASTGLVIQPKLTVGAAGDQYEQEADRVAATVVEQMHSPGVASVKDGQAVQRMGEDEDDLRMKPMPFLQREAMDEDDELQLKPMVQRVGAEGGEVSADVEGEISRSRGSGQPLATELQERMGQAMKADFRGVRVHTDGRADRLNRAVGARAFTTGREVFFKMGEYQPWSKGGQSLIAHELTHVMQQGRGGGEDPGKREGGRRPVALRRFFAEYMRSNHPMAEDAATLVKRTEGYNRFKAARKAYSEYMAKHGQEIYVLSVLNGREGKMPTDEEIKWRWIRDLADEIAACWKEIKENYADKGTRAARLSEIANAHGSKLEGSLASVRSFVVEDGWLDEINKKFQAMPDEGERRGKLDTLRSSGVRWKGWLGRWIDERWAKYKGA